MHTPISRAREWRKMLPEEQRQTLIAHVGWALLGVCSFGPTRDQRSIPGTGEFYDLYVDPAVTGQGIGNSLLAGACELLADDGFESVTIWVRGHARETQRFLGARGFIFDAARAQDSLRGDDTEVRYRLKLREDDLPVEFGLPVSADGVA